MFVTGAGILSLSAGQAKGTGWIPSIAISATLGMISGRTFVMVGEACDMLGEGDFKVSCINKRPSGVSVLYMMISAYLVLV